MSRSVRNAGNRTRRAPLQGGALELLGIAPMAAQILRYFLIRPAAHPSAGELQRVLNQGRGALQRELKRLVALGALERKREGRQVRYHAVPASPVWRAVSILESASADPTALVREAVFDVPGVRAAFIFGSTARGTPRDDSDIDLFVVEDPIIDRRKLLTQLAEVALLVGREVNAVRYTPQALGERLGDPTHPASRFVRGILAGPKRWIAGDDADIASLINAACIPLTELDGSPS